MASRPLQVATSDLRLHVQPRASRNEIVCWRDGVLTVRLTAPPVEGAANKACRDFLAQALGVRRADVKLVAGEKSREKRFRITDLDADSLAARLRELLAGSGPEPGPES